MTTVSAIVRTWNSEATIGPTLDGLRRQIPPLADIVVVDSASTDRTVQICEQHGCLVVPYPEAEEFNYAVAINLGISRAKGERLLIVSSHVALQYPDIVRMMSHYVDEFGAAGAYCRYCRSETELPAMEDPIRGKLVDVIHRDNFDGFNGLWNPCALIRRDCWAAHPYSESMPTAEDQEWALWHYVNSGMPTVSIRNAGVVYSNLRYTLHKDAFEYAVIAHLVHRHLKGWRNILRLLLTAGRHLLSGQIKDAACYAYCAWEIVRAHFSTSHWRSRVHYRSESTPGPAPGKL